MVKQHATRGPSPQYRAWLRRAASNDSSISGECRANLLDRPREVLGSCARACPRGASPLECPLRSLPCRELDVRRSEHLARLDQAADVHILIGDLVRIACPDRGARFGIGRPNREDVVEAAGAKEGRIEPVDLVVAQTSRCSRTSRSRGICLRNSLVTLGLTRRCSCGSTRDPRPRPRIRRRSRARGCDRSSRPAGAPDAPRPPHEHGWLDLHEWPSQVGRDSLGEGRLPRSRRAEEDDRLRRPDRMPVRELGLGEGKDHSSLDDLLRLIEAFCISSQKTRGIIRPKPRSARPGLR